MFPLTLFHCCSFFLASSSLSSSSSSSSYAHPGLMPPTLPLTPSYYPAMVVQSLGLFYQVHTVRIERLRLELLHQEQRGRQVDNQNRCYPNPENYHHQTVPQPLTPYSPHCVIRCPVQNGVAVLHRHSIPLL